MTNTLQCLLLAFAMVESSNRDLPPYRDGKTKAFGYYAFHLDRWQQFDGKKSDWGKASAAEQDRVMTKFIVWGLKQAEKKKADTIRFVATYHNNGHYVNAETKYTIKIRRELVKCQHR